MNERMFIMMIGLSASGKSTCAKAIKEATIISSDFSIVDMDPNIDGKILNTVNVNSIIEEVEVFVLLC